WQVYRPFYVYPILSALLLWLVSQHNIHTPTMIVLILLLGLLEWMILEYVLHRFFFHLPIRSALFHKLFQQRHENHHKSPRAMPYVFVPVSLGLSLSAINILLRTLVVWSWQGAVLVTVGIWAGYLCYEYIHYSSHLLQPRNRYLRYLRVYHMKHHHQDEH